jgi:uncharacterized membrane protein YkvA (DUF1232 family)
MAQRAAPIPDADLAAAERALRDPIAALTFVRDVALLLKDCVVDVRVPRRDKWVLAAVGAYLLSPLDVIPESVPVLGQLDDLGIALWGLRRLLHAAGPQVVTDLWRGDDDGLALVLSVAGLHRQPT